jgi:hypothetical protein
MFMTAAEILFCGSEAFLDRENNRKGAPFATLTFNAETAAVTVDDVLDDRKTKTGAAKRSTAMVIGAVETLGQTWQVDSVNASAIVDDLNTHARRTQNRFARTFAHAQCNPPT